jgi:peptidoglycan/xylan/chitin deacetylase (PgdA/CDA1 family)
MPATETAAATAPARPPASRRTRLIQAALVIVAVVATLGVDLWRGTLPFVPRPAAQTVNVPVLIYHVFQPAEAAPDQVDYAISTRLFDAQLDLIRARGWRAITAAELARLLETGGRPGLKTFVITIDDGLSDTLTQALPLLQRHGYVATSFVVAGRMGTSGYLSWDEVRRLRDAGIEIGNHTWDHLGMADLSPDEQARTVREAQRTIEAELGSAPRTFAYPGGSYNDGAIAAVRGAGIQAAFTTASGRAVSWANRLTIPRLNVSGAWSPELLLRYMGPGY